MFIIETILIIVALYLFLGILFAIPFVIRGVDVVDQGTHGSSPGFRLIIIPGTAVFWPLLLRKWIGKKRMKNI